ncbi:MAG: FAD-dependent oxidoreductase [Pseudomonadota bacterium]
MVQSPQSVDVLIIGAGAAGLSAALAAHEAGATVAVIEKADKLGGTAAISGGIVWMPQNAWMADAGMSDSRDEAIAYFEGLNHGDIDPARLGAFVDEGPAALSFLAQLGAYEPVLLDAYPDYYLDRDGAKPDGGRALDNAMFSFKELGDWADKIYDGGTTPRMMLKETPLGGASGYIAPDIMAQREADDMRAWGQALIGRLLKACLDRDIQPKLKASVDSIIIENGMAKGAVIDGDELRAARGVVLATGGFEWNKELTQTFLRGPMTSPASPPGNTGDGLTLAMAAGAALGNMTSAWWMTTVEVPGDVWPELSGTSGKQRALPVLLERTLPHTVMVNRAGQRFCNEAQNYSALAGAFQTFNPNTYDYDNLPAYLVFDQNFRDKYPLASLMPGMPTPNWLTSAETPQELAAKIGVDGAGLAATLAEFNGFAASGTDEAFGRGAGDYDRFYGDRSRPGSAATLGALDKPPYYAVEIKIGALGTNGGAKTDPGARVCAVQGGFIEGLYAAGNVMAGVTGSVYAGAGGTLGPALTFGVVAGRNAATHTIAAKVA